MLNIYATTFMVATRTPEPRLRDVPGEHGPRNTRRFRLSPIHFGRGESQ